MKEKWLWLPDWAADLSLWEDDLVEAAPSADHSFVPYETMAKNLNDVYAIPGAKNASVIVGWGLGALLLLLNGSRKPQGQRRILLSPYADFCDEDGAWTEQNLIFMARQFKTTVEPGVNAFEELLSEEFGEWQDDWRDHAMKIDSALLAEGINFLASHKIENPLDKCEDIQVLYGRMNQLIPPKQTLKLKEFLPGASFKERPKAGHWPPMLLF